MKLHGRPRRAAVRCGRPGLGGGAAMLRGRIGLSRTRAINLPRLPALNKCKLTLRVARLSHFSDTTLAPWYQTSCITGTSGNPAKFVRTNGSQHRYRGPGCGSNSSAEDDFRTSKNQTASRLTVRDRVQTETQGAVLAHEIRDPAIKHNRESARKSGQDT